MGKLLLLVLLLPIACRARLQPKGKFENIEKPGFTGRMTLTFSAEKTATTKSLKTGKYELAKAPYPVTDQTIRIQGFRWPLKIADDRLLDGFNALGVFNKI